MPWNPDTYDLFKEKRSQPFYDLVRLIEPKDKLSIIDLGCGTGELTTELADILPGSHVIGIDSSEEMLGKSRRFEKENVRFELRSIEDQLNLDEKFDLVFSNAAIQWVHDHRTLIPRIVSIINPAGQLVVQLPSQHHNVTNKLLDQLAQEAPFSLQLKSWVRTSPVLETDEYAHLLFENGGSNIQVMEKIYPIIVDDSDSLFEWVSGTALIPYLDRLDQSGKQEFTNRYKKLLSSHFNTQPVFYSFKRIIMSATF